MPCAIVPESVRLLYMVTYNRLVKRPAVFVSLTGLSIPVFEALYNDFAPAHYKRLSAATRKGTPRQRAYGAGGQPHLSRRDQLVMALFWLRVYPTYRILGFFFSLDESNAFRNVADVLETLNAMTTFSYDLPSRERHKAYSAKEVMDLFPDVALVIDAKEQRIERPKGYENQKPYYSGKKKAHTLKNQIGVDPTGRIQHVSPSVPGSKSDITLLRETKLLDTLDDDEQAMTDKGYQGIRDDYPRLRILQPFKASRGHPLTEQQEAANRLLSRYRIVVEHTNAQLNKYQVLVQRFRKGRNSHSQVFRVVAGLVNRRLAVSPLKSYAAA